MKILKYYPFLLLGILGSCKDEPSDDTKIVQEISDQVNAIVIDKNNTKWIGTNEGLYKSIEGGYKLQKLSVSGKVNSLYLETSDLLWIGAEAGLIKATIANNDLSDNAISNAKLSNPNILAIYVDSTQKRWFGSEKGFNLNYNDTWKKEDFRINRQNTIFAMDIEENTINSIASWDGDYYFATSGAKLYRAYGYDASVDAFSGATQWDPPYNGQSITDTMFVVFVDKDGKQWMGGKDGLQVHIGHDPKNEITDYYDELPDTYILAINQAPNGDIWVGTRKGLAVFNGSNWKTITADLPDLRISAIAFDKDGKAWIGTKKGLVNIK